MGFKSLSAFVAAGAIALALGSAAMAASNPIEARQACMKANVKMLKVMVPVMKGESAFDKAAIDAAVSETAQACAGWDSWWGEDTKPGGAIKTEAKAEIWTDKAGFDAASAEYVKAFTAVKAAGDEASFKAAFPALGGSCKGCHEKYRQAD